MGKKKLVDIDTLNELLLMIDQLQAKIELILASTENNRFDLKEIREKKQQLLKLL